MKKSFIVANVVALALLTFSCNTKDAIETIDNVIKESIKPVVTITPGDAQELTVGQTLQFSVNVVYVNKDDKAKIDSTTNALDLNWLSTDTTVAYISNSGMLYTFREGNADIIASYTDAYGLTGSDTVKVSVRAESNPDTGLHNYYISPRYIVGKPGEHDYISVEEITETGLRPYKAYFTSSNSDVVTTTNDVEGAIVNFGQTPGKAYLVLGNDTVVVVCHNEPEFVDLGLTMSATNTLWAKEDEPDLYTWDEAMGLFGTEQVASFDQFKDLINRCTWTWNGNTATITGSYNKTITMTKKPDPDISSAPWALEYWTSTEYGNATAYNFYGVESNLTFNGNSKHYLMSVRLIKEAPIVIN